jgi:hypothetical protein
MVVLVVCCAPSARMLMVMLVVYCAPSARMTMLMMMMMMMAMMAIARDGVIRMGEGENRE